MARLVLQFCVCYNLGPSFNSDHTVLFFFLSKQDINNCSILNNNKYNL